jgi:hypothetical protein
MAGEEHESETRKSREETAPERRHPALIGGQHRSARRAGGADAVRSPGAARDPRPEMHCAAGLSSDPATFWSAGARLADMVARPEAPSSPVLPRLGPPPFPRGGFPLLGFLATVYEHVAQSAGKINSASE